MLEQSQDVCVDRFCHKEMANRTSFRDIAVVRQLCPPVT